MSGQSEVFTANRDTLFSKNSSPSPTKTHALSLGWVYGRNPDLPVFSLQDHDQLLVLYAAANIGVIYNHSSGSQHILQGHSRPISCLCVSEDRRWVVTANNSPSPLLIIWDSYSGVPVCTLFDFPPEDNVSALAFSKDTKYLVTLGAGRIEHLCIWDWTNETETPLCSTEINPNYGVQTHILFNPSNGSQLLSCSDTHVVLFSVEQESLSYSALKLRKAFVMDPSFPSSCLSVPAADGPLIQTAFHWSEPKVLTATARGSIVVWDLTRAGTGLKETQLVPLQDAPFTVLTVTDSCVVTGDTRGQVKFYGYGFTLLAFYCDFNLNPVASISFPKECTAGFLTESLMDKKQVFIRNFVVSTVGSSVFHVNAETELSQTIFDEAPEPVHSVSCHPSLPLVVTNNCTVLTVRDYNSKQTMSRRDFQSEENITCVTFDPQGLYLAVGFINGAVHVLNSVSLKSEPNEGFHLTSNSIQLLAFSSDSTYLAAADSGYAVTVLRLESDGALSRWKCLGRHRSHYKHIQELLFGLQLDSTQPRLLSLGQDRRLVEYDLENSGGNHLVVLSSERVEQSAVPLCMTWYPPLTTEQFLLIASDQYKMKLINSTTYMCRKVVLGPTYGFPIQKVVVLPKSKDDKSKSYYMAYITKNKVGLQILPADGNPFKSNALICHPSGVSSLSCSFDGRFVFTAGGSDCTVMSWDISVNLLEAAAALGGTGMEPFYSLLEGGREGRFYREMEDFFYYIQIRHQGTDSKEKRQVYTRIPLTEVSTLMRATGCFPSEQEIEDMQNEVKFSKYAETGKYVTDIDLEEFIKLYINHRPVSGVFRRELHQAFTVLCDADTERPFLERHQLLQLLQAQGEAMTEDEVVQCFSSLLGLDEEQAERSTLKSSKSAIPKEISLETFAHQILGFPSASDKTSSALDQTGSA